MAAGGGGVAQQAELRRIEGNACFKKARLGAAIDCYTEASIAHLPSPRLSFICPYYRTKQLDWIGRDMAVASDSECFLRDESLLGNRALPRRRRLLDESGPVPFQAQVSLLLPLPSPPLGAILASKMKIWSVLYREWAKVEEDSRRALALDDTLVKVATFFLILLLLLPVCRLQLQLLPYHDPLLTARYRRT